MTDRMRTIAIALTCLVPVTYADQSIRPPVPASNCLEVPPEVREAWHLKPTDCLHAVPVVRACDVTPPDVAKQLGLKLQCPNWPKPKR